MGNAGHERFVFVGSVGPGAFVESRQDGVQVGHIDYTRCNGTDEVRLCDHVQQFCSQCIFYFSSRRQQIEAVFDDVKTVDVLDSKDQAHLTLMSRPELGVTFTKLHCWTLTDYEKCVFLDADTLVSDRRKHYTLFEIIDIRVYFIKE